MRNVIRYEVVEPHRCESCGALLGQTSETRAWLYHPADRCPDCDGNLAALFLLALWDDLKVTHIERPTNATEPRPRAHT